MYQPRLKQIKSDISGPIVFQGIDHLEYSSNLFWDNLNARLGIGTSAPNNFIDVFHSVEPMIQVTRSLSDFAIFGKTIGEAYLYSNDASSSLTFYTDGLKRMEILPNGNVGIDIIPTERFDVNGNGIFRGTLLLMDDAGLVGNPDLIISSIYNSRALLKNATTGNTWFLHNQAFGGGMGLDNFSIGTSSNNTLAYFAIDVNGQTAIANSLYVGNLGPATARFQVRGTDALSANFSAIIQNGNGDNLIVARNDGFFGTGIGAPGTPFSGFTHRNLSGPLGLWADFLDDAGTAGFTIKKDTDIPTGISLFSGTFGAGFGAQIFMDGTSRQISIGGYPYSGQALNFMINYQNLSSTERFAIGSGSHGIDSGANLYFYGAANSVSNSQFNYASIEGLKENATDADISAYLKFSVSDGSGGLIEAMRIDSNQRVMIGATSSTYKTYIESTISNVFKTKTVGTFNTTVFESDDYAVSLTLDSFTNTLTGSGGSTINLNNLNITRGQMWVNTATSVTSISSLGGYWLILANDTFESIGLGQGGSGIHFNTLGTEKAVITSAGDFGLGIGIPTARFHAVGIDSTNGNYAVRIQNSSAADMLLVRNDSKVFVNGSGFAADITFGVNGAAQMDGWRTTGTNRIRYGSNDIQLSDNRATIEFEKSTSARAFVLGMFDDTRYGLYSDASTWVLVANDAGDVGIGSTNPTGNKLIVVGADSLSSSYSLRIQDGALNDSFYVRNDRRILASVNDQQFRILSNSPASTNAFEVFDVNYGPIFGIEGIYGRVKLGAGYTTNPATLTITDYGTVQRYINFEADGSHGYISRASTGIIFTGLDTGDGTQFIINSDLSLSTVTAYFKNQVGIGISSPDPSAKLDISSTTQGVLIPRMTTAQRNLIVSPLLSLKIFNLTTNHYEYYDGAVWVSVLNSSDSVETFNVWMGRDANATNIYLRGPDGIVSNISSFIVPFNATIIAISAGTSGAETWTAEVHDNGVLIPGATLSIVAADSGQGLYNINVAAGTKIQLFCNGTTINRPNINVVFKKQ